MCKNPKNFWKKAVLVALAAILGVSILAAPVSAEDVKWTCYLEEDGPQESVTRISYVNPELATPSLICFPEFKNIGKPAEELRACDCTCDRYGTETGGIALLEDKPEVLLAEDCKNMLHCTCTDMNIPAFEHYREMTPNEAREWYDKAETKVMPRTDAYSNDRSTKDKSDQWVKDLAYEALINGLKNKIKDSGGIDTLTPTQLNFWRDPNDNEALTDFLIEETMRYVNLQESEEWFKTEVIQGREDLDKDTNDMTDSEWKEYKERWNDASERYPSRQKSLYLTDDHIDTLSEYLMDGIDIFDDRYGGEEKVYVVDSGEETVYIVDSGEETHKIEEIPYKQIQPKPTPYKQEIMEKSTPKPTVAPTPIQDSDGDGWDDEQERRAGTNPHKVDTDMDGIWDPQDPNPSDPNIPPKATPIPIFTPGFKAIFVIAGILAMAYLLKRRD